MNKIPTIAIIGRTNVGKSTLFNQISGRSLSIVKDEPGVTRDRNYTFVKRLNFAFTLIDTGGIIGEEDQDLSDSVRAQAELAIEEADIILAVFDGLHGIHPHDSEVIESLRRVNKSTYYLINKCEKEQSKIKSNEFYELGIDNLFPISAAHNDGIREVFKSIQKDLNISSTYEIKDEDEDIIKIAILGKPNVGKSTLVNKITNSERQITSEIAGTTLDNINIPLIRDGQKYEIIDTAGLRKKSRINLNSLEKIGSFKTLRAVAECNVAILMIDASQGKPSEQDLKIAGLIHERGIPFLLAINKWDLVEKDHKTAKSFEKEILDELKFAQYAPIIFVSALTGKRCPNILSKAKEIHDSSKMRIQTSQVNKLFEKAFSKFPPPVYRGEPIKLYFSTQVGVTPPSFVLFLNHPRKINFSYERYLKNAIRRDFPFTGSNIRIMFRKRQNQPTE